jgi:fatty acid desaturase
MTSTLIPRASATVPDLATNAQSASSFTALTRRVHELNLMRRRYGYYWTKLIGALVILAAWVLVFIWIGDSWWQLFNAGVLAIIMAQLGFLGHDAAHRQIFKSGRWNDWTSLIIANLLVGISYGWWRTKHNRHHANPNKVGSDPDVALGVIAMTPEQATRPRSRLMRWLVSHQGWYFFPILMLEGLSLRSEGFRRVVKRGPVERRWVEFALLTVRLAGLVTLAFLVLSPGTAAAFLTVEMAVFGLYLGSSFAPNHVGMPLVSPRLKLDFLRRQVLMSRTSAADASCRSSWAASTSRSNTTCSPQWPAHTSARCNPWSPPTARPKACPTRRWRCGSPTVSSSDTSIASDCAAGTHSSARSSRNAARCNRRRAADSGKPLARTRL